MSKLFNIDTTRTLVSVAGMLVCTAACLFAATADAQPADHSTRSRTVRIADLDLSTAQGRIVLDRRLKHAAEQLCSIDGFYSRFGNPARRRCISRAIEAALPDIMRAIDATAGG